MGDLRDFDDGEQNSPPPGQGNSVRTVPEHVLHEERERRRALQRELELVKEMVNDLRHEKMSTREQSKDQYDEYIDKFDDDTKKGIEAFIEKKLSGERKQIGAVINTLADRNDLLEFKVVAGTQYDTYSRKVEAEMASLRKAGIQPPPRHIIFNQLKTKEAAEKYERMERESRAKAREVYGEEYTRETVQPRVATTSHHEEDYFSGLNDSTGGAPAAPKPRKSFREMSVDEKEAALARIEL